LLKFEWGSSNRSHHSTPTQVLRFTRRVLMFVNTKPNSTWGYLGFTLSECEWSVEMVYFSCHAEHLLKRGMRCVSLVHSRICKYANVCQKCVHADGYIFIRKKFNCLQRKFKHSEVCNFSLFKWPTCRIYHKFYTRWISWTTLALFYGLLQNLFKWLRTSVV